MPENGRIIFKINALENSNDLNNPQIENHKREGSNSNSRYGDEYAEKNASLPDLPNHDNENEIARLNEMPAASTRFGDDLSGTHEEMENVNRVSAAKREEEAGDYNDSTNDQKRDDNRLWDKLKHKAEDFGDGVKKAFE